MLKTYFVFIVIGYDQELPTGQFSNSVELQLIAKNQAEAEKRAPKILKRKFYKTLTVIEKYVGQ